MKKIIIYLIFITSLIVFTIDLYFLKKPVEILLKNFIFFLFIKDGDLKDNFLKIATWFTLSDILSYNIFLKTTSSFILSYLYLFYVFSQYYRIRNIHKIKAFLIFNISLLFFNFIIKAS